MAVLIFLPRRRNRQHHESDGQYLHIDIYDFIPLIMENKKAPPQRGRTFLIFYSLIDLIKVFLLPNFFKQFQSKQTTDWAVSTISSSPNQNVWHYLYPLHSNGF